TLTVTPKPRNLFAGWGGDVQGATARLTFQMQSNLMVQANVVTNPFIPLKGTYTGLFREDSAVHHESSGLVNATTTEAGTFSAKMLLAGKPVSFSGAFAIDGRWTNVLQRTGQNPITLRLSLDLMGGSDQLTGSLSEPNWQAQLVAN